MTSTSIDAASCRIRAHLSSSNLFWLFDRNLQPLLHNTLLWVDPLNSFIAILPVRSPATGIETFSQYPRHSLTFAAFSFDPVESFLKYLHPRAVPTKNGQRKFNNLLLLLLHFHFLSTRRERGGTSLPRHHSTNSNTMFRRSLTKGLDEAAL